MEDFLAGFVLGVFFLVTVVQIAARKMATRQVARVDGPCWMYPEGHHGHLDPCVHCGHQTDNVCRACYEHGDDKHRDVCPCCRGLHYNIVHIGRGLLQ